MNTTTARDIRYNTRFNAACRALDCNPRHAAVYARIVQYLGGRSDVWEVTRNGTVVGRVEVSYRTPRRN